MPRGTKKLTTVAPTDIPKQEKQKGLKIPKLRTVGPTETPVRYLKDARVETEQHEEEIKKEEKKHKIEAEVSTKELQQFEPILKKLKELEAEAREKTRKEIVQYVPSSGNKNVIKKDISAIEEKNKNELTQKMEAFLSEQKNKALVTEVPQRAQLALRKFIKEEEYMDLVPEESKEEEVDNAKARYQEKMRLNEEERKRESKRIARKHEILEGLKKKVTRGFERKKSKEQYAQLMRTEEENEIQRIQNLPQETRRLEEERNRRELAKSNKTLAETAESSRLYSKIIKGKEDEITPGITKHKKSMLENEIRKLKSEMESYAARAEEEERKRDILMRTHRYYEKARQPQPGEQPEAPQPEAPQPEAPQPEASQSEATSTTQGSGKYPADKEHDAWILTLKKVKGGKKYLGGVGESIAPDYGLSQKTRRGAGKKIINIVQGGQSEPGMTSEERFEYIEQSGAPGRTQLMRQNELTGGASVTPLPENNQQAEHHDGEDVTLKDARLRMTNKQFYSILEQQRDPRLRPADVPYSNFTPQQQPSHIDIWMKSPFPVMKVTKGGQIPAYAQMLYYSDFGSPLTTEHKDMVTYIRPAIKNNGTPVGAGRFPVIAHSTGKLLEVPRGNRYQNPNLMTKEMLLKS